MPDAAVELARGSSGPEPDAGRSAHFFRNYNRLVGTTYVLVVAGTILLFLFQIAQKQEDEVQGIRGQVARHGQFIEFVLRSSQDALEAMRLAATASYEDARGGGSPTHPLRGLLRQGPDGFDLDAAPDRDATGNVTGLGSLAGRSAAFESDLQTALELGPVFQSIAFNLPNAAQAAFTSRERFSHVYPWVESHKRSFSPAAYEAPSWQMGTPEHNPNREKYWAPVLNGGPEQGLLVPTGVPVYDGTAFRGVLTIYTSLDYLNRINGDFGYPTGTVFLVDANDQVLAHPQLFADALKVHGTQPVDKVLPPGILPAGGRLADLPPDQPLELAGHLVIRHAFVSAPWHLVYIVPRSEIWLGLLRERGPVMLAVVLGLTLLMVVTYGVTSREFIAPAERLVAHIAGESQFKPAPIPAVPATWRPWFETISKAFRESLQLAGIRQELDIAARMQHAILPRHWPRGDAFALWGTMRSAKEIGGDFYDHFPLEGGRIGIVVADVSGKGVPAALFGMVSKTLIRATAARYPDAPGQALASVNDALAADNENCTFVTVFYGVYQPADGTLVYANAGHPAPLLVHADGSTDFLPMTGGTALGVMDGLPFDERTVTLQAGECVMMYSDGVTEAFDPQSREFGADRLPPVFAGHAVDNVQAAVQAVIAAVDAHAAGAPQSDDITCVALACLAPPPAEGGQA